MFFFFYGELGELEYNAIVKSAFEKMMFEKLQSEGYCDINPLIGRPRTSKSEIENNLKPFVIFLFSLCQPITKHIRWYFKLVLFFPRKSTITSTALLITLSTALGLLSIAPCSNLFLVSLSRFNCTFCFSAKTYPHKFSNRSMAVLLSTVFNEPSVYLFLEAWFISSKI